MDHIQILCNAWLCANVLHDATFVEMCKIVLTEKISLAHSLTGTAVTYEYKKIISLHLVNQQARCHVMCPLPRTVGKHLMHTPYTLAEKRSKMGGGAALRI